MSNVISGPAIEKGPTILPTIFKRCGFGGHPVCELAAIGGGEGSPIGDYCSYLRKNSTVFYPNVFRGFSLGGKRFFVHLTYRELGDSFYLLQEKAKSLRDLSDAEYTKDEMWKGHCHVAFNGSFSDPHKPGRMIRRSLPHPEGDNVFDFWEKLYTDSGVSEFHFDLTLLLASSICITDGHTEQGKIDLLTRRKELVTNEIVTVYRRFVLRLISLLVARGDGSSILSRFKDFDKYQQAEDGGLVTDQGQMHATEEDVSRMLCPFSEIRSFFGGLADAPSNLEEYIEYLVSPASGDPDNFIGRYAREHFVSEETVIRKMLECFLHDSM